MRNYKKNPSRVHITPRVNSSILSRVDREVHEKLADHSREHGRNTYSKHCDIRVDQFSQEDCLVPDIEECHITKLNISSASNVVKEPKHVDMDEDGFILVPLRTGKIYYEEETNEDNYWGCLSMDDDDDEENGINGEFTNSDCVKELSVNFYDRFDNFINNAVLEVFTTSHPNLFYFPDTVQPDSRRVCRNCIQHPLANVQGLTLDLRLNPPPCMFCGGDGSNPYYCYLELLYLTETPKNQQQCSAGKTMTQYDFKPVRFLISAQGRFYSVYDEASTLIFPAWQNHNNNWPLTTFDKKESVFITSCQAVNATLNGANGEKTNKNCVMANPRARKEAKNHTHQRKTDNRNAAAKRVHTKNKDDESTVSEESVEPQRTLSFHGFDITDTPLYIIVHAEPKIFFNGREFVFYREDNIGQILFNNNRYYFISPDSLILKVVPEPYGVYRQQANKGSDTVLEPYLVLFDVVSYVGSNPLNTLPKWIDRGLFKMLRKKFPNSSPDIPHSVAACKAFVLQSEVSQVEMPQNILDDTVHMFLYVQKISKEGFENNKLLGAAKPIHLVVDELREMSYLGVTQQHNGPWLHLGEQCNLPRDYEKRDDVYICPTSRGFSTTGFDVNPDIDLIDQVNHAPKVYFNFHHPSDGKVHYYRTKMCHFSADSRDSPVFSLYEPDGHNATEALKRMFGTNEVTVIGRFFQYNLSPIIARTSLNFSGVSESFLIKLMKTMRVSAAELKRDVRNNEPINSGSYDIMSHYMVGSNKHNHYVLNFEVGKNNLAQNVLVKSYFPELKKDWRKVYNCVQNNVGKVFGKMMNRCSRGFLQAAVDGYHNSKSWLYYKVYDQYLTYLDMYDSRKVTATEMAHVKKALRTKWFKNIQVHNDTDILVRQLDALVKKEFAKIGKVPRLFVSYGEGGIYASELPEYVKLCIHGEYRLRGDRVNTTILIMSKMKTGELDCIFRKAAEFCQMQNEILIVIYSDDSLLVGNVDGHLLMMNLDISSCDASNRFPIFQAVASLLSKFSEDRAIGLVRQCCLPMELRNPSDPSEVIKFEFDGPFEGSGTLLTTINNHVASAFIAAAIHGAINSCVDNTPQECVRIGALMVGHKLTIQECNVFEELQFLKRSPLRCVLGGVDDWYATLNYGTIFRGFGSLEGDMSAEMLGVGNSEFMRMSWQERMDSFLSVVVQGLKTEPASEILDALEQRFVVTASVETEQMRAIMEQHHCIIQNTTYETPAERPRVLLSSLCNRYKCADYQITQLCQQITMLKIGVSVASDICGLFFERDY